MLQYIRNGLKKIRLKNAPCVDAKILIKYEDGLIVNNEDKRTLYDLSTIGYIHLGTKVEFDEKNKTIEVRQTAKTTSFGKRCLKILYY
jgi:hypothetical protein